MKKIILNDLKNSQNEFIKIVSYLFVGGTSALFEWLLFYILFNILKNLMNLDYSTLLATGFSFCIATLFHYILGNIMVFNSGVRYNKNKEISLVFLVSIVGLLLNLLLMYIFVAFFKFLPLVSKIIATSIVVVWNYLARRKWIF